jgi:DNA-binding response OmpR family regulator
MRRPTGADLAGRRRVVVADEDHGVVEFIIKTLRTDGFAIFHAYDGLAATELVLALKECHLLITNTKVNGLPGIELVEILRQQLPHLPILYIANVDRSTPFIEAQLPPDVPILREPFTADQVLAHVNGLLAKVPEEAALPAIGGGIPEPTPVATEPLGPLP